MCVRKNFTEFNLMIYKCFYDLTTSSISPNSSKETEAFIYSYFKLLYISGIDLKAVFD